MLTAGPPSMSDGWQRPGGPASGGAALLHAVQGSVAPPSPAPASPAHGTATVQLQGCPMHDVVLESCALHTFGSTCEGVVVKSPGHPNPVPDELPEAPLLDPLDAPELDPLDPPELDDPLELPPSPALLDV